MLANRVLIPPLVIALILVMSACEPGIRRNDRQAAVAQGYSAGFGWGQRYNSGDDIYWVPPDKVQPFQLDRPIPRLYSGPDDFKRVEGSKRRREIADAYNQGFYCGFTAAAHRPAPDCRPDE